MDRMKNERQLTGTSDSYIIHRWVQSTRLTGELPSQSFDPDKRTQALNSVSKQFRRLSVAVHWVQRTVALLIRHMIAMKQSYHAGVRGAVGRDYLRT
jgi:hypothetical protein